MASEPLEAEIIPEKPKTAEQRDAEARALARRDAVKYSGDGIQLGTMTDAIEWGRAVLDSGLAPRGFEKSSQVVVACQTGAELGLGIAASLRAFYLTPQGKAALYAESALALCLKSGLLLGHRETYANEGTPDVSCTYSTLRKGQNEWKHSSFSLPEARLAGLVKPGSGWEKWPKRMVLARARAFNLHDNFADVLLGVPVEGDLDDLPADALNKTPPPAPVPKAPPAGGFGLLKEAMKAKAGAHEEKEPEAEKLCKTDHAAAKHYLEENGPNLGAVIFCEDCALELRHTAEGLQPLTSEPVGK